MNKEEEELIDNIYDINRYTLRKTNFKYHTIEAKKILARYSEFAKPYIEKDNQDLQNLYLSSPELFEGITYDEIGQTTNEYLKKIKALFSKPEFALIVTKLEANTNDAIETFLLTEENIAQQICNILFEDCDINHSDEYVNNLTFTEFNKYFSFVRACFDFFLKFYQTYRKSV